jgi:RHS repeat-associated protein
LWIRTDFAGASGYFLGLHDGGGNVRMHVYHRNTGSIYVWRDGGNAIISDSSVSAGEPHHIAMWYDAGANQTYLMIDGVTQGWSYTGNAFAVTDPEVWIGGQRYNSVLYSIYQGKVDEVALYDQPVTASTFTNHYSLGSSVSAITNTLTYDANGNRTTLDDGTTVKNYGYQSSTNKLTSIDSLTIQRDASGNRIGDIGGTRSYTYNNANRLSAVLDSGVTTASYVHNALGQRSKKTVGSTDVIYLYDLGGNLIAEHDATGALIRDYVWMNGAPVAQIDQGEVFSYLHVDHLNTPRLATNDSQTVVWRWDSDAFGNTAPDEDPDGDLSGTTVNLRFPGQYFDGETGFYYNYYRTYDPSTGRYLESDPIGLDGGLNT